MKMIKVLYLSSIRIISFLIRVFEFQLINLVLILEVKLGGLSWNEVQLNLVVMLFLKEMIKGAFKANGLRNIIG